MSQKSRLSWRVNEIVIVSVVAAACAVIFWIWDIAVDPATKTLFAAVPEYRPIVAGMWLLAGVLGGYLIRKPGAALYCEIVAAVISGIPHRRRLEPIESSSPDSSRESARKSPSPCSDTASGTSARQPSRAH